MLNLSATNKRGQSDKFKQVYAPFGNNRIISVTFEQEKNKLPSYYFLVLGVLILLSVSRKKEEYHFISKWLDEELFMPQDMKSYHFIPESC